MARPQNPNSVRQRAFRRLDDLKNVKRKAAISILKNEFSIGDSYAATVYASHRTINKQSGTMPQVFTVRDMREGKPVKPYMKVENTFTPSSTSSKTPKQAKARYLQKQNAKIAAVNKL